MGAVAGIKSAVARYKLLNSESGLMGCRRLNQQQTIGCAYRDSMCKNQIRSYYYVSGCLTRRLKRGHVTACWTQSMCACSAAPQGFTW